MQGPQAAMGIVGDRISDMAKRGRKPNDPPTRARKVYITDEQVKLLRMWGRGDVSAGLRWLIEAAAPMVCRNVATSPRDSSDQTDTAR